MNQNHEIVYLLIESESSMYSEESPQYWKGSARTCSLGIRKKVGIIKT